ncbi:unnamed protein product [Paramecium pentaurelia]|uniref:Uncharacterized protein n=1 Tax=Paramecium pentaurelia TaxID=43138 RepID=A0A8S1SSN8_9CILI|nr:unnamed protein product [Paramecium pentaurelia]
MKSRYQGTMNWDFGHQNNMMPTLTLVQSRNAGFGSPGLLLERPQVAQDLCPLLELIKEHTLYDYMEFQKQFASMNRTNKEDQIGIIYNFPSQYHKQMIPNPDYIAISIGKQVDTARKTYIIEKSLRMCKFMVSLMRGISKKESKKLFSAI